jgi:hypothetical protein
MTVVHVGRLISGPCSTSLCLALLVVSACTLVPGTTQKRMPHIGVFAATPYPSLLNYSATASTVCLNDFVAGLRDLGYVDGQTISI